MAESLAKYDTSESPDTRTASEIELTHRPFSRMLGPSSTAAKFNEGWGKEKTLKPIKDAVSVDDVQIELDSKQVSQKAKRESLFPKSEAPAQLP